MKFELTYDFSTTFNTLYSIVLCTPYGYIVYNNIPMGNERHFFSTLNQEALSNLDIIQENIHNLLLKEIEDNSRYIKYADQHRHISLLNWIKDQLTTDVLTLLITSNDYNHPVKFEYNYWKDKFVVSLTHDKDFVVEKTTWKYSCPKCNAVGDITVDKGDKMDKVIHCSKCNFDFKIKN